MRIDPMNDGEIGNNKKIKNKKMHNKSKIASNSDSSFFNMLNELVNDDDVNEEIGTLIHDVVMCGNNFVRSPTPETLEEYKETIKKYIKLVEKRIYRLSGRMDFTMNAPKMHVIVEKVDGKIADITKKLLGSEKNTINYAAKIEEINGLLLDLYK
jgi:uncharacterized protein YaaR (DUF327 family)